MKHFKKWMVTLALSTVLVLVLVPIAANAATQSGTCGADLTWTLTDDGVLTITGTGAMGGYFIDRPPWQKSMASIKQVIIQQGVTTIGSCAFDSCVNLTDVTIPNSVISIDMLAFYKCTKLTNITIPNSVTKIGDDAFEDCSSLTSITIPNSVTSLGCGVFRRCSSLTSISISNSITVLSGFLFTGCTSLTSWTIPGNITTIGGYAFADCTSLTSITIPSSVTRIESNAFEGCSALRNVTIPESVTTIGSSAFDSCISLTSVTIPNGVTSISCGTFLNCSSLTSVTIPNSVTILESGEIYRSDYQGYWGAFSGCSKLTNVTLPNSVTTIQKGTFSDCIRLTDVTIPKSVTNIGEDVFIGCSSDLTIKCYKNSKALDYATENNINVMLLDADTIIVSFDANGGTGAPESQTKTYGTSLTLSTVTPTRSNSSAGSYTVTLNANGGSVSTTSLNAARTTSYSFKNWNTLADGGGTSYAPGAAYTANASVTLYAQWNSTTTTAAVTLPTPTWTGYTFKGWGTSASAASGSTGSYTPSDHITLYAIWEAKVTYTVSFNANGGTGTPSSQTKEENASLTLSSLTPTKKYLIQYNANGGSVSPANKNVSCTFRNWNTAQNGSGTAYAPGDAYTANANVTLYAQWTNPTAGTLATPAKSGYAFDGWFTSASGGTQISETTAITGNITVYAHWTDIYNMGDETYSFDNYGDSDSPYGHCFGMSITSAGYHNGLLDIRKIGGSSSSTLYSFSQTDTVMRPICYYQGAQHCANRAIVAGGSFYLNGYNNIAFDWQEVLNYVRDHRYDNTGLLQIGFRKNSEGGHAINFLRYENVNGQDRIYAYDNNFPTQETFFYRDSSGSVRQAPVQTFSGAIDCIALRDIRIYFNSVGSFDATHVLYMAKDAAVVQGYTYYYMETGMSNVEYVMYVIPASQDSVIIIPSKNNADFIYMDTEYSFGEITDETRGELRFVSMKEGVIVADAVFRVYETDAPFGEPDFTLPTALTKIEVSAFEGIAAKIVFIPDTCTSIGAYAFRNSAVMKIRIPAGCSIASTAFYGCEAVQIFGTPGSAAETFCNNHSNCTFIAE